MLAVGMGRFAARLIKVVVFMSIIHQKVSFVMVEADQAGQRIDNFLSSRLKGLPRSRLYRLLRKGEVRVNKGRVKPEHRLESGDVVRIPPVKLPTPTELGQVSSSLALNLERAILFEDAEWLVLNKPAHLAVHGGSGESLGLIEALRQIRADRAGENLELCHRLDKDTSGCLVIAKKRGALKRFHEGLRNKKLEKNYAALVIGRWPKGLDRVDAPLLKNVLQSGERMVCVDKEGKASQTLYKVKRQITDYCLLDVQPITGRTHQIRVHCKAAGYPIVGDPKYGNDEINKRLRQQGYKHLFLHALSITLPMDGHMKVVSAPLPASWSPLIDDVADGSQY